MTAVSRGTARRVKLAPVKRQVVHPLQGHPVLGEPVRSAHSPARAGQAHPLLRPFPLTVIALVLVLVAFALAMAQLNSATDPDLSASAGVAHVATGAASAAEPREPG